HRSRSMLVTPCRVSETPVWTRSFCCANTYGIECIKPAGGNPGYFSRLLRISLDSRLRGNDGKGEMAEREETSALRTTLKAIAPLTPPSASADQSNKSTPGADGTGPSPAARRRT